MPTCDQELIDLTAEQAALVRKRPATGYRRIRGPVGSGKSLVVAATATTLAAEGKDVLVVTYNITLANWLQQLAARIRDNSRREVESVTWTHFHGWCRQTSLQAGLAQEYGALNWQGSRTRVLEHELPVLVLEALARLGVRARKYDAILVDEGQDFNLDWWDLLRRVRKHGGEMLLVADQAQDLYGRAERWTEQAMAGAGFRGSWANLRANHRLPDSFVPHVRRFGRDYLRMHSDNVQLPQIDATLFERDRVQLRWIQVDKTTATTECVGAVTDMLANGQKADDSVSRHVALLVTSNRFGKQCADLLAKRSVKVRHTFADSGRGSHQRKRAFFIGHEHVNATTVHSFKGWEADNLVLYVQSATPRALRAFYVGITRLARHSSGSAITVVCSAPRLAAYGRTWHRFESRAA